ncbi:MAG: hypothetical protein ACLPID_01995 [Beijerinckiaceae bacterium]
MNQVPPSDLAAQLVVPAKAHMHAHQHVAVRPRAKMSLLRLSALERLAGVSLLLLGLWGLVFWALR